MWVVRMHELLKEKGFTHGKEFKQAAFIHDELQVHFDPTKMSAEFLGEVSKQAIEDVGKKLNLRIPLGVDWKTGDNYAETH